LLAIADIFNLSLKKYAYSLGDLVDLLTLFRFSVCVYRWVWKPYW